MRKKYSYLALSAVLFFYAFTYLATKKDYCDDFCDKMRKVETELKKRSYVYDAYIVSDSSVFVRVQDTTGHNFEELAGTTCSLVKGFGLPHRHVAVITLMMPIDTLAYTKCP